MADDWLVESLDKTHVRDGFDCGEPPLNEFLHQQAKQYRKKRIGVTNVAVRPGRAQVGGYYTLAAASEHCEHTSTKLPRHPVPVALLARLAVDQDFKGHGLGRLLLGHALQECLTLSERIGIHAVVVDALHDEAKKFYEHFGFIPFVDQSLRLFVPLATVAKSVG